MSTPGIGMAAVKRNTAKIPSINKIRFRKSESLNICKILFILGFRFLILYFLDAQLLISRPLFQSSLLQTSIAHTPLLLHFW